MSWAADLKNGGTMDGFEWIIDSNKTTRLWAVWQPATGAIIYADSCDAATELKNALNKH